MVLAVLKSQQWPGKIEVYKMSLKMFSVTCRYMTFKVYKVPDNFFFGPQPVRLSSFSLYIF